jgi:mxaK protein
MKNLHIHLVGAVLSLACIAVIGTTLVERDKAGKLNAAIAAPGRMGPADEDARITLSRGLLLAREGNTAGAQKELQRALQHSDGALQNLARYDLGNLALRQALAMGSANEKLPAMLELAKQQYRDTLLRAPQHPAARYNLERALWLAPEEGLSDAGKDQNTSREFEDAKSNEDTKDDKEQATTTMKNEGGSLP